MSILLQIMLSKTTDFNTFVLARSVLQVMLVMLGLGCGQLLLRMHTAYFQAGTAVVEDNQPADRICIVVSGRSSSSTPPYLPTIGYFSM
jgi:hypothetical protein